MRRSLRALSFAVAGGVLANASFAQEPFSGSFSPLGPIPVATNAGDANVLNSSSAIPVAAPYALVGDGDESGKSSEPLVLSQDELEELIDKRISQREKDKKAADEAAAAAKPDLSMPGKWNKGLEFKTKDGAFRGHVGGRYQLDNSWFSVDQRVQDNINIPYGDGIDLRRARLRFDGTMYNYIDYAIEFDFVNSFRARNQPISVATPGYVENTTTAPTDFWWQVKDVPCFGTVRTGIQKEPIGFEHQVSSRFLPFMERSYNQDAFYGGLYNGFTPGISSLNYLTSDKTSTFHYGIFKPTNNPFGYSTGDGDYSVVARWTQLLIYTEDDSQVLHFGIAGKQATAVSQAGFPGRVAVFRTRDAVRSGLSADWPVPAAISLYGDDMQQANAELAGIFGRMTFQSEYLISSLQDARTGLDKPLGETAVYHGGYVQLLYFLTDDHDHYDLDRASFDRVTPKCNMASPKKYGWGFLRSGAWQIGARYNYLDLNDSGFNGGVLHNQTYGLNWFLNPNMKCQFNYISTYRDVSATTQYPHGSGWINAWGMRIACDF